MSAETESKPHINKYRVISVEKVDPPTDMPEGEWHRYIIGHGRSKIEGFKPGTLKAVTEHAETIVEGFNERTTIGKSAYAPRKQK